MNNTHTQLPPLTTGRVERKLNNPRSRAVILDWLAHNDTCFAQNRAMALVKRQEAARSGDETMKVVLDSTLEAQVHHAIHRHVRSLDWWFKGQNPPLNPVMEDKV
jgi:hypothetical protein